MRLCPCCCQACERLTRELRRRPRLRSTHHRLCAGLVELRLRLCGPQAALVGQIQAGACVGEGRPLLLLCIRKLPLLVSAAVAAGFGGRRPQQRTPGGQRSISNPRAPRRGAAPQSWMSRLHGTIKRPAMREGARGVTFL